MNIPISRRAANIPEGIFAALDHQKEALLAQGRKVYNFSVGTPDFPPPEHVMQAMQEAAKDPENYKYALTDRPELLCAMQGFYRQRFGVELATEQIMSLYGSQEGMAHIALALCDPGDVVLAPDPGYPVFSMGPALMGAQIETYPLYERNNFLPDFADIPESTARRAKFMVVSYPANPVCSVADDEFYLRLIDFARKYDIVVLHDNAYCDIVFDGRVGKSFLSYPGAAEVGVEFFSLSKSYNMTGLRISFALGNAQVLAQFRRVRSQIDYGTCLLVQKAAIAALTGPQETVARQCEEYQRRSRCLCGGLRELGWDVPDSQGSMFVWAPLPRGYTNSQEFVLELMERTGIVVTPGSAFGPLGEGYVRMALVHPTEVIREALEALDRSGLLRDR